MEFIYTPNTKLSFIHTFYHLLHFSHRILLSQFKARLSTLKLMCFHRKVC